MRRLRVEFSITNNAKTLFALVEVEKDYNVTELVEWFTKVKKEGVFVDIDKKLWVSSFIVSVENDRLQDWVPLDPIGFEKS